MELWKLMETTFTVSLHRSFAGETRGGANFIEGLGDSRAKRGGWEQRRVLRNRDYVVTRLRSYDHRFFTDVGFRVAFIDNDVCTERGIAQAKMIESAPDRIRDCLGVFLNDQNVLIL